MHYQNNFLLKIFLTFRAVKVALKKYPPVTNCLTYGTLFCTAELTQQILLKKYQPSQQVIHSIDNF